MRQPPALRWLSSHLVTLRSALSWTRWRQNRTDHRLALQQREQLMLARAMEPVLRQVLLEALTPLAQALQRQDQLLLSQMRQQQLELTDLQQLLLESLAPELPPELSLKAGQPTLPL